MGNDLADLGVVAGIFGAFAFIPATDLLLVQLLAYLAGVVGAVLMARVLDRRDAMKGQ